MHRLERVQCVQTKSPPKGHTMIALNFGRKWRGASIQHVAARDARYLRWLLTIPAFQERRPAEYAAVRAAVIAELQTEQFEEEFL